MAEESVVTTMYKNLANRIRQFSKMATYRLLGYFEDNEFTGTHMAIQNLEEGRHVMRAELSALKKILIESGVVSQPILEQEILNAMTTSIENMKRVWPEVTITEDGRAIIDLVALRKRAEREHWSKLP